MRERTGDWRDLFSAFWRALDPKKVFMGFIAVLFTVFIMVIATIVYSSLCGAGLIRGGSHALRQLGDLGDPASLPLLAYFGLGRGLEVIGKLLPLLNPIGNGLVHFLLSLAVYVALLWAWTGTGGAISRLTALTYARGELPTLDDARRMVKARRMAYFFVPLWPLLAIVALMAANVVGGLIASVPLIGPILLVFPGFPLIIASTLLMLFLAVIGALSFGMMMPAISVGGKDAFEGWSTAYSYVLQGFGRFICYTLLLGVIGVIAAVAAWALGELLIYVFVQTVNLGFVGGTPWIEVSRTGPYAISVMPVEGGYMGVWSAVLTVLLLLVRAVPVAYVFSYFFTANTVVFFLMRKAVDNIDVEEIYEAKDEEATDYDLPESAAESLAEETEEIVEAIEEKVVGPEPAVEEMRDEEGGMVGEPKGE